MPESLARTARPWVRWGLLALALLLVALLAITWWALEASGVARVETRAADGTLRSTHVWFVEDDDTLWLEAGSRDNGWYRDIRRDPQLWIDTGDGRQAWRAHPVDDTQRQQRLRAQLRAKYGVRDWWVGWLVDSSQSIPVRLELLSAPGS
jgi:hypothetical protein